MPLFSQLFCSLTPAPNRASITEPSASKITPSGVPVAPGVTSAGWVIWPCWLICSLVTVKLVPLTTIFAPLTSSFSAPLSVSFTPAVGIALQSAAAASTIAFACWFVTALFNGP